MSEWNDPKRHEPRTYSTADARGFVYQEIGADERPYYTAIVDDDDLTMKQGARRGEPFLFESLKDAKAAVESLLETGAWERPKRRYRAYPTYDPKVEGYGSADQWRATFGVLFERHPDQVYDTLDVGMDATWGQIKASFRRLQILHHPDRGGDAKEFIRIQAAFEKLRIARESE